MSGCRRSRYPALDGLRALAVAGVLLYHFGVGWARGGFLGVDVFFVLSGYLITGQLVTRWVLDDRVAPAEFWAARARRLLPALLLLLAGTTGAAVVLDRSQLSLFRGDLAAAASYTSNWWYVFHDRSYFVAAGRPPLLEHLWSLAVEEQFYLVWPLVFLGVLAVRRSAQSRLRAIAGVAAAGGLASALVMGIGSAMSGAPEMADPSRWYFGTDSHVMGLMAGALLAVLRRGDRLGASAGRPPVAGWPLTIAGAVSLVAVVGMLGATDQFASWLYRVGFTAVSVLTAVVVAAATRTGPVAVLLSRPILQGLGRRSYSIYLWHWPVACFTRPGIDLPVGSGAALALRCGLTLLLAELSYQCVEQPVRRYGWAGAWRHLSGSRVAGVRAPAAVAGVVAALAAGLVAPATAVSAGSIYRGNGAVYVAAAGDPGSVHLRHPRNGGIGKPSAGPPSSARSDSTARFDRSAPPPPRPHRGPSSPPARKIPSGPPRSRADLRHYDLVVYGDSVPLAAIPRLAATFHSVVDSAAVGMQSWTLLPQVVADARSGRLAGSVVVLHTGDNGVVSAVQLAAALDALADVARVVLVVPHVPRPWQDANRYVVRAAAPGHPNVRLADWDSLASHRAGLLTPDGVHLTPPGERVYARLVADAAVR